MQRIFLTGLSGAGKSTVGRHVATLLNWDFIDTDDLLAAQAGMSVGQALTEYGETRFRQLESDALRIAASRERVVIATGGGLIISEANRTFMREQGLVIYLRVEVETAWQRIQEHLRTAGEQAERPLVAGSDGQQRLRDLLATRAGWYAEAPVQLVTDAASVEHVVQQVFVNALAQGQLRAADAASISSTLRLAGALSQATIAWGSFCQLPEALRAVKAQRRVFIVTDASVGALYADAVCALLEHQGLEPHVFTVPTGEVSKSFTCLQSALDWLVELRAERSEPVVALGGGVVGDLTGFVASCYQRGVPLIQLPTTLLAQVDSAIGGKTGINHARGKNLIGAYYQPELIFVDPAMLLTLPERVYREGWAEIVKYGVILDAELFALLEDRLPDLQRRDADLLTSVVARCIRLKMDVVQGDERDSGLRNLLNYGHTFGHALEAITEYGAWLHGEAVSIGMEVAGNLAVMRGLITQDDLTRQRNLLTAIGLPDACPGVDGEAILAAMQHDKKVRDGRTRWILPTSIGQAQIYSDVPLEQVREAVAAVCQSQGARV
ncbi:MAG TPA: 3-dehydroquinate synthase [Ktedonobacteraceae bacterium]|nr:3-dehydroquinate synthase [Ktedonobacteraceae bacterium]